MCQATTTERLPPRIRLRPPGLTRAARISAVALALAWAWPTAALAGDPPAPETVVSYHVVSLDAGDLIVDVGHDSNLSPGDVVEIWRPLKVKHPITGRMLEDRFRIGSLKLAQVGNNLSLARPEGNLTREPKPGDIILVRRAAPPTPATPRPAAVPTTGQPAPAHPEEPGETIATDPEAAELTRIFDALRGTDPIARIRAYEDYVRARPTGRYAPVLYEEAQALRRLIDGERPAQAEPEGAKTRQFEVPADVMEESPLSIGIELEGPAAGAVLHLRNAGEVAYMSQPMGSAGPGYFTTVVPAERVKSPGLEFFIEATGPDGRATPMRGSAERPVSAPVEAVPKPAPPKHREATFAMLTDYADYNRLRGNDYAWQTEGWFALRYNEVGVRAVRSGFGVFRGAGGTIKDLDELEREPRRIGLTYGYLELELGASDFVSIIGRAVVGLRDEGTSGGGQGMLRIGNDKNTNLVLGGEFLGGVGLRGFTQLELNSFSKVPIVLRSEVTNQPAGLSDSSPRPVNDKRPVDETSSGAGDVGARGIVQVGYRVVPSMVVSLRASYQGRTIHHAGPGVGAGVTYQW